MANATAANSGPGGGSAIIFELLTLDEVDRLPDKEWVFQDFLGKGDFMLIYGKPGAGKSFVAIEIAMAAVRGGISLAGEFPIEDAVRVLYATGEKLGGIKSRFKAARLRAKLTPAESGRVRVCLKVPQLFDPTFDGNVDKFIEDLRASYPSGFDILVIDTLHCATVGCEENSSKDAGIVIESVRQIIAEFGCAVILIHHANRAGTGERGSSAYRGSVDGLVEVAKSEGNYREMRCEKMGEADDNFAVRFHLELVPGAGSMAVVWDGKPSTTNSPARDEALRILSGNPGRWMEIKEVFAGVGPASVTQAALTKALNRLAEDGVVQKTLACPANKWSNRNPHLFMYAGSGGAAKDLDPFADR